MNHDNMLAYLMEVLSIFVITKDVISMSCMSTSKYIAVIILAQKGAMFFVDIGNFCMQYLWSTPLVAKGGRNHSYIISTSCNLDTFL